MRYRPLGSSGLMVSVVGLGTNSFGGRLDAQGASSVVSAALDAGVTLIDTADCYGDKGGGWKGAAEEQLGQALKGRRDRFLVATKFGRSMDEDSPPPLAGRASRWYVQRAVEASLRRLGTDWIDLYQLHRPDGVTPFDETLDALDDLVRQGKIRYVGSSNMAAWQIVEASWISRCRRTVPFVSAQHHYSLLERSVEAEVVPACLAHGVALLAYYPLSSGLLSGRWGDQPTEEDLSPELRRWIAKNGSPAVFDQVAALSRFGSGRGLTLLELAIGGLAAQPAVASVITGATRPEQVLANAAASDWVPGPAEVRELAALTSPVR